MAVESVTYINTLDPNLPAASDGVEAADDHLRNIKRALKDTFPNITGPVTATQLQLNSAVPIGAILMWSGSLATIPAGWVLCNGQTVGRSDGQGTITTPNLLDRFVVAAGAGYTVGMTGGGISATLTTAAAGAHTHGAGCQGAGAHSHGGGTAGAALGVEHIPPHSHGYTVTSFQGGFSGGGLYSPSNIVLSPQGAQTDSAGGGQAHAHGIFTDGNHAHQIDVYGTGDHTHTVTLSDYRPYFYAVAFVMKF